MVKDVKRAELVKQYVHVPPPARNVASNFAAQNLPMVAMFMKSKPIAWACLFLGVQAYLNTPLVKAKDDDSQPPIFRIVFALLALGTSYMDLFFPGIGGVGRKVVESASESVPDAV